MFKSKSFFTLSVGALVTALLVPSLALAGDAPAKRSGKQTLTPDQKEAVHSIILGLETLKADPDTAGDTIQWIQEQVSKSKENLTETRSEIERLRAEIEAIKQKKEELEKRLNALAVARTLLSESPTQATVTPAIEKAPATEAKAPAGPAASDADAAFFKEKVYPILEAKCFSCHGPEKQKNGLRLDSLDAAKKGGEYGPAVVPGDPDKSLLVEAIRYKGDIQMPPKEQLSEEEVAILTDWVKRGAPWGG